MVDILLGLFVCLGVFCFCFVSPSLPLVRFGQVLGVVHNYRHL